MSKIKRVGIIGGGWLGSKLAQQFADNGLETTVTSQTEEKLSQFNYKNCQGELLSLPSDLEQIKQAKVFQCDALVIAITPQIRKGKKDYVKKIEQIVIAAKQNQVRKIILINTTAIYGQLQGEVDENATIDLLDDNVALLARAEELVLTSNLSPVVLRVAGLVGPERHPGSFFRQGRVLKSPNNYVNLVHQYDVIACIVRLIEQPQHIGIYNVVSETHLTKKRFYQQAAESLNRPMPEFESVDDADLGKLVVGDKIRQAIDYQFKYDDLISWLAQENCE